jgi:hypothetical protein
MLKRLFLFILITISVLSMNCTCSLALSPKISLDSRLVGLTYTHIDSLARVINDDELLLLGEVYKINDLILKNMQHIDYAAESDVSNIVNLFGRIREQDSWGFDPGNKYAEEESFQDIIKSDDSLVLVYRISGKTRGYINLAYALVNDVLNIEVKEIVVDKNLEGKQIAKALSLSALQKTEERFKHSVTRYRISGVSANEKIYGERGLATKTGFQKLNTGFDIKLLKEIKFSAFTAIQTLQSI